jgi:phosphoenolpyruvate phosphomutase
VVVIRGYQKEKLTLAGPRYYDNDRYTETGEVESLFVAEPELEGRLLFLYGDILFDQSVLEKLLRSQSETAIIVDRAFVVEKDRLLPLQKPMDLVVTENPPRFQHRFLPSEEEDRLLGIGQRIDPDEATGEFIGMALFSESGTRRLKEIYHRLKARGAAPLHEADRLERAAMTDMLSEMVREGHAVSCVNIYKGWLEIDTFDDYQRAWAEIRS